MELPFEKTINKIEETEFLANQFSKIINNNDVIILNGNLGSGKTTLIKFICSNFGIENVTSPSFSIVNEYSGDKKVYHFDFYRLKKIEELYDIGFEEYLNDSDAVIFIEWGNLMQEILPNHFIEIDLALTSNEERKVKIFRKNEE